MRLCDLGWERFSAGDGRGFRGFGFDLGGDFAGFGAVHFFVEVVVDEDDGTLTMKARIPYALLRHSSDPWVRTTPGLFLEPYHFHVEFEMLPDGVEPRPFEKPKAEEP